MKYAVIFESGANNWSAYAPDVPGCVAAGETQEEVERLMREGLAFHFEGMAEDGVAIPPATSRCGYVEVEIPEPVAAA